MADSLGFELGPYHRDGDPDEYVNFGDVSRHYLRLQAQYGSRYVNGFGGAYPALGEGLSFQPEGADPTEDYHTLQIRRGDVPVFVARYLEYRQQELDES